MKYPKYQFENPESMKFCGEGGLILTCEDFASPANGIRGSISPQAWVFHG
jgi:hypothetical protein